MTTYLKDPQAILDYSIDWSTWLAGDTIATSTWTVPAGIVKDSDTNTATRTTIWLSGGSAGVAYSICNHITTAALRQDDRTFIVQVEDR